MCSPDALREPSSRPEHLFTEREDALTRLRGHVPEVLDKELRALVRKRVRLLRQRLRLRAECLEALQLPGPRIELFARGTRPGWVLWGDQADEGYKPTWKTYSHNSNNYYIRSNDRIV